MCDLNDKSIYHNESSSALLEKQLVESFYEHVLEKPDKECLICYDASGKRSSLTFMELASAAQEKAKLLRKLKVAFGSSVGIYLLNSLEMVVMQFAMHLLQCNVVFMRGFKNIEELQSYIKTLGISSLVYDNSSPLTVEKQNSERVKSSRNLIFFCDSADFKSVKCLDEATAEGYSTAEPDLPWGNKEFDARSPAVVLLTSGSTGIPKAVQHTHFSLLNASKSVLEGSGIGINDKLFTDHGLNYVVGVMLGTGAIFVGRSIVVVTPDFDLTNTKSVLQVIEAEECTHIKIYSSVICGVVNSPDVVRRHFNLQSIKGIILGGQTTPENLKRKIADAFPNAKILLGYGLSESLCPSFTCFDSQPPSNNMCGKVSKHHTIKIVGDSNDVLPWNKEGEILIKGFSVCQKYLTNNKLPVNDGWLRTGDIGRLDRNGYLCVVGRNDDLIKRSGKRIYPLEIETILLKNHMVQKIVVVGLPDEKYGNQICACIVLNKEFVGQKNTVASIKEWWLREKGSFPEISFIHTCETFPVGPTGKLDRRTLKENACELLNL